MNLILINTQGASETHNVDSVEEAKEVVNSWSDPENFKARLYDEGVEMFDGEATDLLEL